jgi:ribosomal protein L19
LPRGKKIAVEPGKSINVEDFGGEDVNENNIEDPETDNDTEITEFNNEPGPSTSQAVPNHQQVIPVEFEIDDFILVKYETNKSFQHYIGQILNIDYPIINVNFLRKKNSLTGPPTFVFPIVADKSRIKVTQVVKIVKLLNRQKRDRYIFDIDASEIE